MQARTKGNRGVIKMDRSLSDTAVETATFLLSVGGELAIYLIAQTAVLLALTG